MYLPVMNICCVVMFPMEIFHTIIESQKTKLDFWLWQTHQILLCHIIKNHSICLCKEAQIEAVTFVMGMLLPCGKYNFYQNLMFVTKVSYEFILWLCLRVIYDKDRSFVYTSFHLTIWMYRCYCMFAEETVQLFSTSHCWITNPKFWNLHLINLPLNVL